MQWVNYLFEFIDYKTKPTLYFNTIFICLETIKINCERKPLLHATEEKNTVANNTLPFAVTIKAAKKMSFPK